MTKAARARRSRLFALLLLSTGGLLLSACGSGNGSAARTTTDTPTKPKDSSSVATSSKAPTAAAASPSASSSTSTSTDSGEEKALTNSSSRAHEEGQADNAAVALQRMLSAIEGGRGNAKLGAYALCTQLSASARKQMIRFTKGAAQANGCETAITSLLEQPGKGSVLAADAKGQIVEVQIHGAHGTAVLRGAHGKTSRIQLMKEGGQWKLAGLG